MNYRTACPTCNSVFRLGADQLDVAQGWVQCSVCGTAFDARLDLRMEDGAPLPRLEPEPAPPEVIPADIAPADSAPAPSPAAVEPPAEARAPRADETNGDVAAVPQGIAQRDAPSDLPSIILIDPDLPAPDDFGPLPQFAPVAAPAPAAIAAAAPLPEVSARIEYAHPRPRPTRRAATPRRVKPWVWASASVLLLLTLLGQGAYFMRDILVSRMPALRPAFERACAQLGCHLSLPRDASLVRILGSDLRAEPGNPSQLRLSLTLGNHAGHPQAWPVLVLTLKDLRDQPLARRSFAPSEYLASATQRDAGMAGATEYPLSLTLTTRQLSPAGYQLELRY